jgi:hypothetical protein
VQTSPTGECLHSSWRAFHACSEANRHQPAPLLASTSESGVFLTVRGRIAVVGPPAFGGRDDRGPRSHDTRERTWTRPHCSSSSSWCCCSAAVDSSTDAGSESEGRCSLAGNIRPLRRTYRLRRAVAAVWTPSRRCARDCATSCLCNSRAGPLDTRQHTCFDSAATQINAGAPLPPLSCATQPRNGRSL